VDHIGITSNLSEGFPRESPLKETDYKRHVGTGCQDMFTTKTFRPLRIKKNNKKKLANHADK